MEYIDFELHISQGIGRAYPVAVINSPAGLAQETMHFPYDGAELRRRLHRLRKAVSDAAKNGGSERTFITGFGQALFKALIKSEIESLYRLSVEQAAGLGRRLRIKLHILPPELSVVPWDFLYDDELSQFVGLSRETPIVRYLDLPRSVEPVRGPAQLKVLGVISSPSDLPAVDTVAQKEVLERAVADLRVEGLVELTWLPHAIWPDFRRALEQESWHVLHFIGHAGPYHAGPYHAGPYHAGPYHARSSHAGHNPSEAQIAFDSPSRLSHYVPAAQLARALTGSQSMRLVMLDTVAGTKNGKLDRSPFVASELVRQGIAAVVAMQFDRSQNAALAMDRAFYYDLANGWPVDAALANARLVFHASDAVSADWAAPALFLRSAEGVLFDFQHDITPPKRARPTPATSRPSRSSPFWQPPFGEPAWIEVGAGDFWMGTGEESAINGPAHKVTLDTFRIAQTPISNAQYRLFVRDTGTPPPVHWSTDNFPEGLAEMPVTQLSWNDALAYCAWLSAQTGLRITLPSEAEWEKSARGTSDQRIYPWGDRFSPGLLIQKDIESTGPFNVGLYPETASPFGVHDMSGNVWEWTRSLWGQGGQQPDYLYPYRPDDGREQLAGDPKLWRVLRGGSFQSNPRMRSLVYRGGPAVLASGEWWGFRVVCYP
jgi:formylglycine-generating enzyme required for sulfatase activity